jgi:hypothetical protein
MDPLRFAIAVVPLAAYLAVVGLVNLRPRPLVVSGSSDIVALGMGLVGLVFVGPIELFRPELATGQFLNYIWPILLLLYLLTLALIGLVSRPRLVFYNLAPEELRPALSEAASKVDPTLRWAGDTLVLPRLGVQLYFDSFALWRNTSLVSGGPQQSLEGWRKLTRQLKVALRGVSVRPHPPGAAMISVAVVLVVTAVLRLEANPDQVAEAWQELLGFGWERS